MVFQLQDTYKTNKFIKDQDIEMPQLLAGVSLDAEKFDMNRLADEIA